MSYLEIMVTISVALLVIVIGLAVTLLLVLIDATRPEVIKFIAYRVIDDRVEYLADRGKVTLKKRRALKGDKGYIERSVKENEPLYGLPASDWKIIKHDPKS